MSQSSNALEYAISNCIRSGDRLPNKLPQWMINLGILPGAIVIGSHAIGSQDRRNKTDVYIELQNSEPIKISAKLSNADYFGNWYGHVRFLEEFGEGAFLKQTQAATHWANWWMNQIQANIFVGVSICYGRRSGNTAQNFLDVYSTDDLYSICRGYGEGHHVANCLYSSDYHPRSQNEVLNQLMPINDASIRQLAGEFKIAYRPINPMTEGSNRGKNVYTMFQPNVRFNTLTQITSLHQLRELGSFVPVQPNRVNHNHILDHLKSNYNLVIPRK